MSSELHLDSKGNCFLCLKVISEAGAANGSSETVANDTIPSLYSLQDVTQYLDMDLGKVFKEKDPITHRMMVSLENLSLKVPLCDDCISINLQFSTAFQQLEKFNLEMVGCIKRIHDQLVGAVSTGHYDRFRKIVTSVTESGNNVMTGKLNIVNLLRIEAMRKSASFLYNSKQSGKLQMMKRKINKNESSSSQAVANPGPMETSSFEMVRDFKSETTATVMEDAFDKGNVMNIESESTTQQTSLQFSPSPAMKDPSASSSQREWLRKLKGKQLIPPPIIICSVKQQKSTQILEGQPEPGPSRKPTVIPSPDVDTSKFSLIPSPLNLKVEDEASTFQELNLPPNSGDTDNAKYCCKICSKRFRSKSGLYFHSKSVHQSVRYKCQPCGKEYVGTASFRRHYNTVHMGVRHICNGCGKTYTQIGHLKYHKQTSCVAENLKPSFRCEICGKMLAAANVLRRHVKNVHMKIKNHVCCFCEMRFHLNCQLQQHLQKIHGEVKQQ